MVGHVTVREFGHILKGSSCQNPTLDQAVIPDYCFEYLVDTFTSDTEERDDADSDILRVISKDKKTNAERLQVRQFVGLIETPDQTIIEILPKVFSHHIPVDGVIEGADVCRDIFIRMLGDYESDDHKRASFAGLVYDPGLPLLEIFISYFLNEVTALIKTGVRSDYVSRQDNLLFQRGRLNAAGQLRHNLIRSERFCCEFDEYLPDRAENRLIHSALHRVARLTHDPRNWRLCREALMLFDGIPLSSDIRRDFRTWRRDRNMVHYEALEGWCRMLLADAAPQPKTGDLRLLSILFPMNKVFEHHVTAALRRQARTVPGNWRIKSQVTGKRLLQLHDGSAPLFALRPDLAILNDRGIWAILDVKWKVVAGDRSNKFGILQGDVYQVYAYGRYFGRDRKGDHGKFWVILVYPDHPASPTPVEAEFCDRQVADLEFSTRFVPIDNADEWARRTLENLQETIATQ